MRRAARVVSVLVALAATLALIGGRPPAAAQDLCADKPDGWPCADEEVCTAGDWCQSGVCVARDCAVGKGCGMVCGSNVYCNEGAESCVCTASQPPRFVDNGDGTVTDTQTGLMWEKKTDNGSVHDKDNLYTWTDLADGDYTDPDGTAFTEFLGALNNCEGSSSTTVTGGFAGYCDWRLPTHVELQTILLAPHPCSTSPCIDPILGPTAASYYWSSTTNALNPNDAWVVYFDDGDVLGDVKGFDFDYVRAVRGGW